MKIINSRFITSASKFGQLPNMNLPEIAFMGRSNVGKSSLINTVLQRKNLAQISKKPGKTRTINLFNVEYIDSEDRKNNLIFADLPGYGYATVPDRMKLNWKRLIENYLQKRKYLCGVVIIIDIRHKSDEKDIQAVRWVRSFRKPFLIIATKSDKLSISKANNQLDSLKNVFNCLDEEQVIGFSAKNSSGKDIIIKWLEKTIKNFDL
ncbi:MAG: YihA family ribosome biogenesis GTP-binding protein [Candidatus Cloacimonetes bacterium]|nr:YihA family ribosome biogenesis GTP-binding protein [Candidatus Cloacimonadota bacterium]